MPKVKRESSLASKGKDKIIHPESREAKRMARSVARSGRVSLSKEEHILRSVNPLVERVAWFRDHITTDTTHVNDAQMHMLIQAYLTRNDLELANIKLEHSQRGQRHKAAREDFLEALIARERSEYASGFQAPDLTIVKNLAKVKEFNGTGATLPSIKMREFKQSSNAAASASVMLAEFYEHQKQLQQQGGEEQQQQQLALEENGHATQAEEMMSA